MTAARKGAAAEPPPAVDIETERQHRKPHTRVYAATAAYSDILAHNLGGGYYSNGSRTCLYRLHAPKSEGTAPDQDAAQVGEGEEARHYYFYPEQHRGGMIRVVRVYVADKPGQPLDENTHYDLEATERLDRGIVSVTEEELNSGKVWAKWGGIPITKRRDRDVYADMVKMQIGVYDLPVLDGHTTTGFHRDRMTGASYYLLPDGRTITAQGEGEARPLVDHDMPPKYATYFAEQMPTLAAAPPCAADLARLLAFYGEAAPNGHLLITIGATLRTLVHTLVPAATIVISEGLPESGKTSSQMHARGIIGPSHYRSEADGVFTGTATSLELAVASFSDGPAVVDNFRVKPTDTAHEIKVLVDALDRLTVSAENGGEMRARATQRARKQQGNTIKTLPLLNGEKLPDTMVSSFRRMVLIPFVKDQDILLPLMEAHEKTMQPILTQIGHAVIRARLSAREASEEADMRDRIARQEDQFVALLMPATCQRKGADLTLYRSVPANWARVLTGLWLAEQFAGASGYVDAAIPHVIRLMNAQLDRMTGATVDEDGMGRFERVVRRFIEKIRDHELIGGQTWQIDDVKDGASYGNAPNITGTLPAEWGHYGDDEDRTPVRAGRASADHREIYLYPKAIDQLCRMAERIEGSETLVRQNELWQAAQAEGWISRRGEGCHRGIKIGAEGKLGRGWAMRLDKWLDLDDQPEMPPDIDASSTPTASSTATVTPAPSVTPAPVVLDGEARTYIEMMGETWGNVPYVRRALIHYADCDSPPFPMPSQKKNGPPDLLQGRALVERLALYMRSQNDRVLAKGEELTRQVGQIAPMKAGAPNVA